MTLPCPEIWNSARNEGEECQRGLFGPDTDRPVQPHLVVDRIRRADCRRFGGGLDPHPTRLWS